MFWIYETNVKVFGHDKLRFGKNKLFIPSVQHSGGGLMIWAIFAVTWRCTLQLLSHPIVSTTLWFQRLSVLNLREMF